jgi:dolichyl-phosphate beta-glucosyltransferase
VPARHGARYGAGEVEIKKSLSRWLRRVSAVFVNLLVFEGIADTQRGFKIFCREAVVPMFSRQKTVGFAFDVEILFIAQRLSPYYDLPGNQATGRF